MILFCLDKKNKKTRTSKRSWKLTSWIPIDSVISKQVMYLKNKQNEKQFAKCIQHFSENDVPRVQALRMISVFRISFLTVILCTAQKTKKIKTCKILNQWQVMIEGFFSLAVGL